jgi:hypothetical protein
VDPSATRQRVVGKRDETAREALKHTVGVYGSAPAFALSAVARGKSDVGAVLKLLGDQKLIRIRCMRQALYAVPVEVADVAYTATAEYVIKGRERGLKHAKVDAKELSRVGKRIEKSLQGGRVATKGELRDEAGKLSEGANKFFAIVLSHYSAIGMIVRAGTPKDWRDGTPDWALAADAAPAVSTVGDVDAARVELARLYLEAFGPATLDDFAWWSGFTKTVAKQVFEELFGEVPANTDVVDAPNPPRARAARGEPLRLLPPWDTYLVAYKDRSRYADDDHLRWLYDKRGNAAPVVMHEGRAAGLWQFDDEDVRVAWLPDVKKPSKKAVADEAARTGKLLGFAAKPKLVEVECPKPLAEQKVNAHLAPLG